MFKQVKSAFFWYYLYKFRRRVILIVFLLITALFANAIYSDIVDYLRLKEQLQYLEIVLISKWIIILFNILFSVYLLLTMFKKEVKEERKKEKIVKKEKTSIKNEKFTDREKQFLHKKKLKTKADSLLK